MASLNSHKLCSRKSFTTHFQSGIDPNRASFITKNGSRWLNGTQILFFFIEDNVDQRAVVLKAFETWEALGLGISFAETDNRNESMLRIGFDWSDGSWSYVGAYNLKIPKSDPTMNFGWDLTQNSYGLTTALHEIGHALGLEHEHQSSNAGIEWNREAIFTYFRGGPNYCNDEAIEFNILQKISGPEVLATPWDPQSIMQYEFGKGLIRSPKAYSKGVFPPGTLSETDKAQVKSLYPQNNPETALELLKMQDINVGSGSQQDFVFVAPYSGKFTFNTIGEMDAVLRVSERSNVQNIHLSADNDAGFDRNAKLTLPLVAGRHYQVSVGVQYSGIKQHNAVVVT